MSLEEKRAVGGVFKNTALFFYYLTRHIHFKIFFSGLCSKERSSVEILFSSMLAGWRSYVNIDGEKHIGDFNIGIIMEENAKRSKIAAIDIPPVNISHPFRPRKETKNKFKSTKYWFCLEQFMTSKMIVQAYSNYLKTGIKGRKNLELNELKPVLNTNDAIRVMDIDILINLSISRNILDNFQPKIVFMSCEFDQFNRVLTYVAKKKGIKTMALQHGVISAEHRGYVFNDEQARKALPHTTFVWGPCYRDTLIKQSVYHRDEVLVSGSPRYDFLKNANSIYSRKNFCKKHGIPAGDKILLWTTQSHALPTEENRKNCHAIFKAVSQLEGVRLIIKPHQGEGKEHSELIRKIASKHGVDAIIMPKDSDTYEQIFSCDLLITKHSTTAVEAIILDKPVIVLNLSGKPDPINYVKEGVAKGAYKPNELKNAIKELLTEDNELRENRKAYIEKYIANIGNATAEILKVIRDVTERR